MISYSYCDSFERSSFFLPRGFFDELRLPRFMFCVCLALALFGHLFVPSNLLIYFHALPFKSNASFPMCSFLLTSSRLSSILGPCCALLIFLARTLCGPLSPSLYSTLLHMPNPCRSSLCRRIMCLATAAQDTTFSPIDPYFFSFLLSPCSLLSRRRPSSCKESIIHHVASCWPAFSHATVKWHFILRLRKKEFDHPVRDDVFSTMLLGKYYQPASSTGPGEAGSQGLGFGMHNLCNAARPACREAAYYTLPICNSVCAPVCPRTITTL